MRFRCRKPKPPVDIYEWHSFFTILPRRMQDTDQCVVMEWIMRKRTKELGSHFYDFIYRLPEKV